MTTIKLYIVLLLLASASFCKGQKRELKHRDEQGFIHVDTTVNNSYCITVIIKNNKDTLVARDILLNRADCIYNGPYRPMQEAVFKYGGYCAVLVRLKPGVETINLKQIFDLYHIDQKDRKLSIFVDKMEMIHCKELIAVKNTIASVKIITGPKNQRWISILTKRFDEDDDTVHHG